MKSPLLRCRCVFPASSLALVVAFSLSVHGQTVFRYSFTDTTVLPDVLDASPVGNDATAGPLAVLSEDIPAGNLPADAGNRSLDSGDLAALRGNQSGIVTTNTLLLSNVELAAADGFTIECWFKWDGGGAVNSIIDYAGTEKIVLDQRNGATSLVEMRISGTGDIPIGDAEVGVWHYVAVVFDTDGADVVNNTITGTVTTYFDSLVPTNVFADATKDNFGDSLVRGIGVGQHPLGFDLDFFAGKVFEPRVSLEALPPDELLVAEFNDEPLTEFRRGDSANAGTVNLTSAIFILNFLFTDSVDSLVCEEAGDVNNDGLVNLTDPVSLLNHLFGTQAPPEPPGLENCGPDPDEPRSPGDLGCEEYTTC